MTIKTVFNKHHFFAPLLTLIGALLMPPSLASGQILPNTAPSSMSAQQIALQRTWQIEGNANFATPSSGSVDLELDGNQPYVVFTDKNHGEKVSVMTLNSARTAWVNVGPAGFSPTKARFPMMAIENGEIYVAFEDYVQPNSIKTTIMRYNHAANDWELVGPRGISQNQGRSPDIEVYGGIPYVAYSDAGAVVQKFDKANNTWVSLGGYGFSVYGQVNHMDLEVVDDTAYVSYFMQFGTGQPNRAFVKQFDPSTNLWNNLGSVFYNDLAMWTDLEIKKEDVYLCMNKLLKFDRHTSQWNTISPALSIWDLELSNDKPEITHNSNGGANGHPHYGAPYYAHVKSLAGPSNWNSIGQANITANRAGRSDLEINPTNGERYLAKNGYNRAAQRYEINVMRLKPLSAIVAPTGVVLSPTIPSAPSTTIGHAKKVPKQMKKLEKKKQLKMK